MALAAGCAAPAAVNAAASPAPAAAASAAAVRPSGNYTNEMKIPESVDLGEYGAESVDRKGDHRDSPYFSTLDFYNMESTDSLTILPHFKTYQQSSEWSCGVAAALMVLNYYGKLDDYNEKGLAQCRDNGLAEEATTLKSILKIFQDVGGFQVASTYDFTGENLGDQITLQMIRDYLKAGTPVIVGWNDWGGHWQVIIGYDTMGSEDYTGDDVIIVADSYDTTDHNQDGYGVYGAERFYYNWTMYDFFESYGVDERDYLFAAAVPAA